MDDEELTELLREFVAAAISIADNVELLTTAITRVVEREYDDD